MKALHFARVVLALCALVLSGCSRSLPGDEEDLADVGTGTPVVGVDPNTAAGQGAGGAATVVPPPLVGGNGPGSAGPGGSGPGGAAPGGGGPGGGGGAVAFVCNQETFDHDGDPTTPCQSKRNCPPGQYVVDPGSEASDRVCNTCPPGTTTRVSNTDRCLNRDASLSGLEISSGVLDFDPATLLYVVTVETAVSSVQVTPSVANGSATIEVNNQSVLSGAASPALDVAQGGITLINVRVRAESQETQLYSVTVVRGDVQHLKASNAEQSDYFGERIALSGDTLAVAATGESSSAVGVNGDQEDNSAPYSGAVYVFTRSNGTWTQQAYLKASNSGEDDRFGHSLALDGDTLVVGSVSEASSAVGVNGDQGDNSAPYSGAVYVFTRSNGTWAQQAYLKASNAEQYDFFGESVALSGDTLAVSAIAEASGAVGVNGNQDDSSATYSGAVYIFTRSNNTWAQQAYLKASNTETNDGFGDSLALDGETLAVGATGEASNATGVDGDQDNNDVFYAGAVYVFTRSGLTWTQEAYLKASNTDEGDAFGSSLDLEDDTLAVGASSEFSSALGVNGDQEDNSAPYSGAVYVFTRNNNTWAQQAYLKASNTNEQDAFGHNLDLSGNVLAVAAPREGSSAVGVGGDQSNNGAGESGAVYLFARDGDIWTQTAYVKGSKPHGSFGSSVALTAETLAVGASAETSYPLGQRVDWGQNGIPFSGAVYTFCADQQSQQCPFALW